MIKKLLTTTLALFSFYSFANYEPGSHEAKMAQYTWTVEKDRTLPNVMLIGDSISIGYTIPVREKLKGKANVFRPIKDDGKLPFNAGDTANGLKHLDSWLNSQGVKHWDVIHFNWGLHDLKRLTKGMGVKSNDPTQPPMQSLAQYERNLNTLVERLKRTGAKLIFATTTPYPDGVTPARIPSDANEYNKVALAVMAKHGVAVNDLYNHIKPKLTKLQLVRNVHFNKKGSDYLADKVSAAVLDKLRW